MSDETEEAPGAARIDKWLWMARFFKTRSRAAKAVTAGVRVNGARVEKPSAAVRPGDVLTFAQETTVRVVEICALGSRRGPASEAQTLYVDVAPPVRTSRTGRPDKRARAQAQALRGGEPGAS